MHSQHDLHRPRLRQPRVDRVDELRRSGLHHIVICPGSRSTPLALSFAATPEIRTWMHIDERSAAFFALGLAKRLCEPVALLCTSGTAAANFLPAIVEANLTHVPLLILTADRPPELRDCGAPQAIDQNRLYGTHVRWFMETALPEASNAALRSIRTIACRAFASAQTGPVHLNMPLREPLTPAPIADQPLPPESAREPLAWRGRPDDQPYIQVHQSRESDPDGAIAELADEIAANARGLILVGPQTDADLADALLALAGETGYPILADPLSQLRSSDHQLVISSYDAFLRGEAFSAHYAPQLILRFGSMPTSKPLLLYLQRHAAICTQVIIDPQHGWQEPTQLAAQMIYADAGSLARALSGLLQKPGVSLDEARGGSLRAPHEQRERVGWQKVWVTAERVTREALAAAIGDLPGLFEGRVFTELAELLPERALLYAGNSMPVRDMDTFFWPRVKGLRCLGNRGASGIDGVISSALGASAASEAGEVAVLVIGDLSFLHDLNGLLAAKLHRLNLVIVLVNNDGGGIFSFLPQAAYPEHFEQLFGTPIGLDFRPAVAMYGGRFERVTDWMAFRRALQVGLAQGGLHVIEVPSERESNVQLHRQLWQVVELALSQAGLSKKSEV